MPDFNAGQIRGGIARGVIKQPKPTNKKPKAPPTATNKLPPAPKVGNPNRARALPNNVTASKPMGRGVGGVSSKPVGKPGTSGGNGKPTNWKPPVKGGGQTNWVPPGRGNSQTNWVPPGRGNGQTNKRPPAPKPNTPTNKKPKAPAPKAGGGQTNWMPPARGGVGGGKTNKLPRAR